MTILTFMLITLFSSSVLAEESGAALQSAESAIPFPSFAGDGSAVTQTWQGSDGATYMLVIYPETTVTDCSGTTYQTQTEDALTSEELLNILNWVESQIQTEAVFETDRSECQDPAVFWTAMPLSTPAPDAAVYYTAQPAPIPAYDPMVFQTAQPSAPPCTAEPSLPLDQGAWATPAPMATPVPQPVIRPTAMLTVSTGDYTTFESTMQEQKLLNLLNEDRARNGLPPLTLDPELSRLAQLKSSDMNSNHYFAHESPTYGNAGQMLTAFHYDFNGVGENIAHHANVEKAEAAFMSSDGHRRNILGSQWDKVGIGIAYDENGNVYVTQLFAR